VRADGHAACQFVLVFVGRIDYWPTNNATYRVTAD
jgi:hypothetical protein